MLKKTLISLGLLAATALPGCVVYAPPRPVVYAAPAPVVVAGPEVVVAPVVPVWGFWGWHGGRWR